MSRWVIVLCVLLTVGCGSESPDDEADTSPSPSPAASSASSTAGSSFVEQVDIGGGVMVNVKCAGEGSPTVLLEGGDESGIEEWNTGRPAGAAGHASEPLMTAVSKQTRVCAYDRLGVGASDEASGCRQLSDLLAVRDGMLAAAEIPGPYVVVGASGGGYITAGHAYAHPGDVVGLMLLDTFKAIDPTTAPPELVAELACDHPANAERRDYVAVEAEAWNGRHDLGPIPVTVITNDYSAAVNATPEERTNVEDQKGWLVLSPLATQILVYTGHDVATHQPALVAEEILKLVAAARGQ
jgi:pimeloyl-ACP methyl ester carboxylesterase